MSTPAFVVEFFEGNDEYYFPHVRARFALADKYGGYKAPDRYDPFAQLEIQCWVFKSHLYFKTVYHYAEDIELIDTKLMGRVLGRVDRAVKRGRASGAINSFGDYLAAICKALSVKHVKAWMPSESGWSQRDYASPQDAAPDIDRVIGDKIAAYDTPTWVTPS